jgi:hypothetical protein
VGAGERHGTPVRDRSTAHAERITVTTTQGAYLTMLGLYDPQRRAAIWNPEALRIEIQRAAISIRNNTVKEKMIRDLMRGGLVPPTQLVEELDPEEITTRSIIDRLQRAHCQTISLMKLLDIEAGAELDEETQELVAEIRDMRQEPLSVDAFLEQPFEFQLWHGLTASEVVRLFIVLNAGQQKVSPRHLLEIMGRQLATLFASWACRCSLSANASRLGAAACRTGRSKDRRSTATSFCSAASLPTSTAIRTCAPRCSSTPRSITPS